VKKNWQWAREKFNLTTNTVWATQVKDKFRIKHYADQEEGFQCTKLSGIKVDSRIQSLAKNLFQAGSQRVQKTVSKII